MYTSLALYASGSKGYKRVCNCMQHFKVFKGASRPSGIRIC